MCSFSIFFFVCFLLNNEVVYCIFQCNNSFSFVCLLLPFVTLKMTETTHKCGLKFNRELMLGNISRCICVNSRLLFSLNSIFFLLISFLNMIKLFSSYFFLYIYIRLCFRFSFLFISFKSL